MGSRWLGYGEGTELAQAAVAFVHISQVDEDDHVVGADVALAQVDLEGGRLRAPALAAGHAALAREMASAVGCGWGGVGGWGVPVLARAVEVAAEALDVAAAALVVVVDELPALELGLPVQQLHHRRPERTVEAERF